MSASTTDGARPLSDPTLFSSVDSSGDPQFYVRFMDEVHRVPDMASLRRFSIEALDLHPGHRMLEVGCGPALDAAELAERLGPDGHLTGVDSSEAMIAVAGRRAEALETPTLFRIADARELPFDDASFDACRAERLLMHLTEAQAALDEMSRVTRPGGRVCVLDFDWHTFVIDHPDQATTEVIVRGFADDLADGRIGRQLRRMFLQAGLPRSEIRLHPVQLSFRFSEMFLAGYLTRIQADCRLTPDQVRTWWNELEATVERGTYFAAVTAVLVHATR
jgi:ubiquinone/menaquinone biosynthesis C-methylase UbiE